ncbi:DUF3179 domain-containing (seleno)protein [Rhodovibrionaceae bacterium A322]
MSESNGSKGWGFRGKPLSAIAITVVLGVIFLGIGLFGSFAMTEIAQFLDWSRDTLVGFYEHRMLLTVVMSLSLAAALVMNFKYRFVPQFLSVIGVMGLGLMIYVIHFMVPYFFFPAQHHIAQYLTVPEAVALEAASDSPMDLAEEDRVYVIEINGDAVAYPQEVLWVPHIAGTTIGGQDVAMTYCVLSNLPLAYGSDIEGKQSDLKVLTQAHNNLIMKDVNSGEIIQHILGETEFGKTPLQSFPVQMMPWGAFKALYPEGRVFFNNYDEDFMPRLWKDKAPPAMEAHFEGPDPLFPTLRMDDDRLPFKEQVWGLRINGQELALSRSYFEDNPITNMELGGEPLVIAYFADLDTVGVFRREVDGKVVEVSEIDPHGLSDSGQLERVKLYNGVFWMVWSHWFPNTEVLS